MSARPASPVFASLLLAACVDGSEAARLSIPVESAAGVLPTFLTDLGYQVTVLEFRAAARDLELTIEGEAHAVAPTVNPAILHPGHSAGGEVTGELPGPFVLTLGGPAERLGVATLVVGDYNGFNLTFRAGTADDGLAADDPLLGHHFHLRGEALRDTRNVAFDARIDLDEDTAMIGGVFDATLDQTLPTSRLHLTLAAVAAGTSATVMDGIDFHALPPSAAGPIEIRPGDAAANIMRRALQVHDHYLLTHAP